MCCHSLCDNKTLEGFVKMTGSSLLETRHSRKESVCSEAENESYSNYQSSEKKTNCTSSEKKNEKNNSGSNKSDAIYKKRDCEIITQKPSKPISNVWVKYRTHISENLRPSNRLHNLRSKSGILEPTLSTSKHAQWLAWDDPIFTRRQSIQEQRLCRQLDTNSTKDQKSTVYSFKRSLQLLGLKDKDLGLNLSSKDKRNENKISRGHATPTFSTQLKQRSVSLTNLRNAVQESGLPTAEAIEKMHRDILSRAVYEEWYFRKQTENKIRKELEQQIQKKQEQELEWIKMERRKRSEENFEKWKKMKSQIHREKHDEKTAKRDKLSTFAKEKPGADEAFEAWKTKKDEEIKARAGLKKRLEKDTKRKMREEDKNSAADAAFKAWKQKVDADFKNKLQDREREKKIAEEKKVKEEREKRENAEVCYMKWKMYKDQEIKQNLKQKRTKAKLIAQESTMRKKEREYEAAQAFEEWLDQIEEREEEKFKVRKNSLNFDVLPWYPA